MEAFESFDRAASCDKGVGAKAEASLVELAPLIEYYEREMGQFPGRLMIAASFLGDVPMMPGWNEMTPEVRQSIEKAQALVVSVMIRLLNLQNQSGCNPSMDSQVGGLQNSLNN